jgi:septation ring formation regulator EzrA
MSDRSHVHAALTWAKHRLDDLDTMTSAAEKSVSGLKEGARKEADRALSRLRESRLKLQQHYEDLRAEAGAVKHGLEKTQDALEAEWVEVESAFQSYLAAAKDHADTVRDIVAARVRAQRQSWEASLQGLHDQADGLVEQARVELDAAIKRLSDEAERFQSRIGEAKDAGDESWKAVKLGLAEAKVVHHRTIQAIKDAFSKLL